MVGEPLMDFLKFLEYAAPVAMLAGGAFAVIKEMFRYGWRLAQVEQQARTTSDSVTKILTLLECVTRIEVTVEQLVNDRRHGPNDRRDHGAHQ